MKPKLQLFKKMGLILLSFQIELAFANFDASCGSDLSPLNEHQKLTLIDRSFKFLEGPTWSEESQHFYFSEMDFNSPQTHGPNSTIYRLKLPNTVEIFKKNSGSNGLLANSGKLFLMDHSRRAVSEMTVVDKEIHLVLPRYQGHKFNSPNDLVLSKTGHLYFTDPDWQLSGRTQELPFTGVFQLTTSGDVVLLDKNLTKPNGIALSPNEEWLYVGDYSHRIFRYPINNNGAIGPRELFANIDTPDGLTVDCAGNLYAVAHVAGKIMIFRPNGKIIDTIDIGHKVTNLAFGGAEMKTLLITTDHALYTLKVNIAGAR